MVSYIFTLQQNLYVSKHVLSQLRKNEVVQLLQKTRWRQCKNEEIYLDIEENGNILEVKSLLQFKNCRDSEYKLEFS